MKKILGLSCLFLSLNAAAAEGVFFPSELPLPQLNASYSCQNDTSPHAGSRELTIDGLQIEVKELSEGLSSLYKLDLENGSSSSEVTPVPGVNPTMIATELESVEALNDKQAAPFRETLLAVIKAVRQCKDGLDGDGRPLPFDKKIPELAPLEAYLSEVEALIQAR